MAHRSLALLLFLVGCDPAPTALDAGSRADVGTAVDSGPPETDSGPFDAPGVDGGATDTGVPADAPSADAATDAGPGGRGAYFAYHTHTFLGSTPVDTAVISVRFDQGPRAVCTEAAFGACVHVSCTGGGTTTRVVAGDVTTSGGALGAPITISPRTDGSGNYDAFSSESVTLWTSSSETLAVHAAGAAGGVSSFDGTIGAPTPVVLGSPTLDGTPNIDRAADLVFTWTAAGAPADEVLEIVLAAPSVPTALVRCSVPVADGMLTAPAAALSMLPATPGGITVAGLRRSTATAGPYAIELQADDRTTWAVTFF